MFSFIKRLFGSAVPPISEELQVDWQDSGEYGHKKIFQPDIPDGYQIYLSFPVAGIHAYWVQAAKFANSQSQSLVLERELNNPYDKNAIKIIGESLAGKSCIGYVPKDSAKIIVRSEMLNELTTRLMQIYAAESTSDDPKYIGTTYIRIDMQVLGPLGDKNKFVGNIPKIKRPKKP
jgi:hypothetical protein